MKSRAHAPVRVAKVVLAVLVMLVPTVVTLVAPSATAADNVVFADGQVPWRSVPGLRNMLYFRQDASSPGDPSPEARLSTSRPLQTLNLLNPDGRTLPYGVATGSNTPGAGQIAVLRSTRLTHEVNITGDNALTVDFWAQTPPGQRYIWTVTVKSEGPDQSVGTETWSDQNPTSDVPNPFADRCIDTDSSSGGSGYVRCTVPVRILREFHGRFTFKENARIRVEISASAIAGSPVALGSTWGLRVNDPVRASALEFRAENAVKVATWTTDKDSIVTKVFRPVYRPTSYNRVDAFFAVKSAFGGSDVCTFNAQGCGSIEPESHVLYRVNRTPAKLGLQNATTVKMVADENSTEEQGIVVWRFPRQFWDVGKWPFPTGEFTLQSTYRFRAQDPVAQSTELRAEWDFVVSTQTLSMRPYDDDVAETQPTPLETQAHDIGPGGSTTFLVLAQNGGTFWDNVTIDAQVLSAQPAFGWQVRLAGEKLTGGNRLPIGPAGEELFLVTVTAPPTAVPGQSAVISIITHSTADPQVKSKPYTVIATVSNVVREDVGLVVLKAAERVRPGIDNTVKAFVWNRGTRPANVTLTVREQSTDGWNVSVLGGTSRFQVSVPSVQAGDLAPVLVNVRPDPALSIGTDHNITLNATRAAGGGLGGQRDIVLSLTSISSFRLELLRGINDNSHYVEMEGAPFTTTGGAPPTDAVDGTYFRAWITNTGDVAARYEWFIDDFRTSDDALPSGFSRDTTFIGKRDAKGRFENLSSIDLAPRQTGEIYVWVQHLKSSVQNAQDTLTFELVVNNTLTKQQLRRSASVVASDADHPTSQSERRGGVKIEAVERDREYFAGRPIVKVENALKGSVTKFVDLSGSPQIFYARVTNGNSFRTDADGNPNANVNLVLKGVRAARELGWNVSMRERTGIVEERLNPWREAITLTPYNTEHRRWESFRDHEVEIQVRPPINGSARVAAGETRAFTLEGPGGTSLEFVAVVSQLANVTLGSDAVQGVKTLIHPGQQAAFALILANNGSIETNVSIKTRVTDDTPSAGLWTLSPKEQNLQLLAHENRTLALIVGAPSSATEGTPGVVNVSVSFKRVPRDPNSPVVTRWLELPLEVRPASKVRLTPFPVAYETVPGGLANFTIEVRNTDTTRDVRYAVKMSPLPNWTQSAPEIVVVPAGSTRPFAYLLTAPSDVFKDRTYATVVRVTDIQNPDNFDVAVVTTNIVGGQPFPIVQPLRSQELVNRDATVKFSMGVKNLGNTAGVFPLEAKAGDSRWQAWVENAAGQVIRDVRVQPNERIEVFLVARAPRVVTEGTSMPVTLTAFSPTFDRNSAQTVTALIHDYGVDIEVRPSRADVYPGLHAEFNVRVTNLGNGNDTLNLTADMQGLADWTHEFSADQVTLPPGASTDVRFIVRSPKERLPVARSYTLGVFGGSEGGAGLGLPKNDSAALVASVLNYRAFDVDGDGFLELAVDKNKRTADGFEDYREIFTQGQVTEVVGNLSGKQDGKLTFLLDVPEDGSYDGVADLYYDPQDPFVYEIEYTPDINGDATPDYLLDTDNDGVIDHAWDTATTTLWTVTVIRAFGGTAEQYLVDMNNDGKPDRYFDPSKGIVTKTVPQTDGRYGLLTDRNDRTPSKFFDTKSGMVTDARVSSIGDFAKSYWYFFATFLLVLVVFGAVLARRRRRSS